MSFGNSKPKGLGRGLSSLIGDAPPGASIPGGFERRVAIEMIDPNPNQPRRLFDAAEIDSLAASIEVQGILQPLLVRPDKTDPARFQLVAGERRWRAAQKAQIHEVPVVVRNLSDREALEIALIENIQRADLNPLEEAGGYRALMADFGHTQEAVAEAVGKSRSHVANMVRLLDLPDSVKGMIDAGELTMGHARALLRAREPEKLAATIVSRGLNVRQAERLAATAKTVAKGRGARPKDANIAALERELGDKLGLAVSIAHHGESGTLTISYRTLEQLDNLLHRLSRTEPQAAD